MKNARRRAETNQDSRAVENLQPRICSHGNVSVGPIGLVALAT